MPTKSTLVSDADIDVFKKNVKEWRKLRADVELALQAGLKPEVTLEYVDQQIAATIRLIETYTGDRFRE